MGPAGGGSGCGCASVVGGGPDGGGRGSLPSSRSWWGAGPKGRGGGLGFGTAARALPDAGAVVRYLWGLPGGGTPANAEVEYLDRGILKLFTEVDMGKSYQSGLAI